MLNQTVRVKPWGKDQGDFVEVNAAEFDPTFHVLLHDEPAPATPRPLTREEAEMMADEELRDFIAIRTGKAPGPRSKRETLIERALEV